jgi:hypothetical protein
LCYDFFEVILILLGGWRMAVLFLHGWHSAPGGLKPSYLVEQGLEVINPALSDDDFAEALSVAQRECDRHRPEVVVGSSRGGAVAMNLKIETGTRLVLLCPAWKRWGIATTVPESALILHSQDDEVIPFAETQELLRNSGLTNTSLIITGHEHRLADPDSLRAMYESVVGKSR